MSKDNFDTTKSDAQATAVYPITPDKFELNKYAEYEQALNERCKQFWNSDSGVLVYRRMRVGEVFSYGYRDMKKSLAWQLGALQKSMNYKADVPNFLEPWYGIGTAASAYGIDYLWEEGQAPAVKPKFTNTAEALKYQTTSIAETPIGKQTLAMIEYFLDKTKGKLPVSFCDIQSPLNAGGNIVDISNFMMDFFMDTDAVTRFLTILPPVSPNLQKHSRT